MKSNQGEGQEQKRESKRITEGNREQEQESDTQRRNEGQSYR